MCDDRIKLDFLGSGFPLFYNFIKWCFIILVTFLIMSGSYNIYTNLKGNYCNHDGNFFYKFKLNKKKKKILIGHK